MSLHRARRHGCDREAQALRLVAQALSGPPAQLLRKLGSVAAEVCAARSAGVRLHERARRAGVLRVTPEGTLLVPLKVQGKAIGTLRVIEGRRPFDGEDLRILSSLAGFASAAYAMLARSGAASARSAPVRVTKRILVVNDDGEAADSLAMRLRRMGQEAYSASDQAEASEMACEVRPEAVLLDLARQRRRVLAKRLREHLGPGALIVAVVGRGSGKRRRRAAAEAIDYHVSRPIDMRVLRSLMGDPVQSAP